MISRPTRHNIILRYVCVFLVGCVVTTAASVACAQEVARVYSVEGAVEGRFPPSAEWKPVALATVFHVGDAIRTGDNSRAAILGRDGMMVRLSANALLEFKAPAANASAGAEIALGKGDAYFLNRDPHQVSKVTTSIVSGSIRGTEFAVSVQPSRVSFAILNGAIDVANTLGTVSLHAGEEAVTEAGQAPVKRLLVRPLDAVQWALRYPTLISLHGFSAWFKQGAPTEFEGFNLLTQGKLAEARQAFEKTTSTRSLLGKSLIALQSMGTRAAADQLTAARGLPDLGILTLEAGLALASGQIAQAEQLHTRAETLLSNDHSVGSEMLRTVLLSQRATVQVVKNEVEAASHLADQIAAISPDSVEGLFVRSLVQQAQGNVAAARQSVHRANEIENNNAELLAREAELAFGMGETAQAEKLIGRALEQDSGNVDAASVKGFILLARGKVDAGQKEFERALSLDGANASSHLGLGISRFQQGALEEGRMEIQKAVHLDPAVAMYRSYLGKAFFENERETTASEELAVAKKLDPRDPTPYLYSAFNNLATFKPVEALNDLEDAIARNGNRAVYRSRLLLDQDEATRGTGLGRIFSALDFVQPARIEALKSLAEDPANYSAHALLKDSLIGPEVNTASVSEDVTATLLAPATFSGLLPTASGSASLNEYSTLFERPQSRTEIDIFGQTKERRLETSEVFFAGGANYSYLLRHGMTFSDGYRDRDYERTQTGRALAQYDVTPDDKILGEGIFSGTAQGDRAIGIHPNANDPDQDIRLDDYTGRLGYHHSFGPHSQVIGQALFVSSRLKFHDRSQERPFNVTLSDGGVPFDQGSDEASVDVDSRVRTQGVRGDVEHLWSSDYLTLTSGGSIFRFRDRQSEASAAASDTLGIFQDLSFSSDASNGVRAYRAYSYATLKPLAWARLVGGVNYSALAMSPRTAEPFVERESRQSRWSPKVGFLVYPWPSLTLRASYLETLGAVSSRDLEGIEPAQVAGIRQVFDDPVGTRARVLGVGIDWKAPKSSYLGIEAYTRALAHPLSSALNEINADTDGSIIESLREERFDAHAHEHVVGAYLNQIVTHRVVASVNYDWTETKDDFDAFEIRTHRVRVGLNYFDPSGFFAFSSGTWRSQQRDGFDAPDASVASDFWICSGGVGWQLPHRHGSVQLAVRNIFNRDFSYQPIASDVTFYPGVDVSLGINIDF